MCVYVPGMRTERSARRPTSSSSTAREALERRGGAVILAWSARRQFAKQTESVRVQSGCLAVWTDRLVEPEMPSSSWLGLKLVGAARNSASRARHGGQPHASEELLLSCRGASEVLGGLTRSFGVEAWKVASRSRPDGARCGVMPATKHRAARGDGDGMEALPRPAKARPGQDLEPRYHRRDAVMRG